MVLALYESGSSRAIVEKEVAKTQVAMEFFRKKKHVTLYWRFFMARGRKTALSIHLTPEDRHTLMSWQRSTTIPAGRARRGRIILQLADGVPISHIANTVGISRRFVYKWVKRFMQYGVEGLADKPGRGHRPLAHRNGMVHNHSMRVG